MLGDYDLLVANDTESGPVGNVWLCYMCSLCFLHEAESAFDPLQVGTPRYRPPEGEEEPPTARRLALAQHGPAGWRPPLPCCRHTTAFDIYSFGVCLLYCLVRGHSRSLDDCLGILRTSLAPDKCGIAELVQQAWEGGIPDAAEVQQHQSPVASVAIDKVLALVGLAHTMLLAAPGSRKPTTLKAVAAQLRYHAS